ncbi:MAG TPA: hypothetical protein VNO30_43015 [Kofleriaceae bacterium]|nr:hypothetical protein [Kofleriaceae bacterium]
MSCRYPRSPGCSRPACTHGFDRCARPDDGLCARRPGIGALECFVCAMDELGEL